MKYRTKEEADIQVNINKHVIKNIYLEIERKWSVKPITIEAKQNVEGWTIEITLEVNTENQNGCIEQITLEQLYDKRKYTLQYVGY